MLSFLSINIVEWLALLALLCTIPLYIVNYFDDYLGKGGLWGFLRLFLQGSVKGAVQWGTLGVDKLVVRETEQEGGRVVGTARTIRVSSTLWNILMGRSFTVSVLKPWLDLTTTETGQLYLTRLLMEVGLMREVKAERQPEPVYPTGGGDEPHKGIATILMEAQVRVRTATINLDEGRLLVSEDMAEVIGKGIFFQAAVGLERVKAALSQSDEEEAGAWYESSNWPETTETSGEPLYPLIIDATSDHMTVRAQGWRTTTGVVLERPIRVSLDFSPSLASLMLAKVHPLLGAAVGLDQGERITGFLMPLAGHHPAEVWNVRARPMKLGMQGKGLVKGLLKLLKMAESGSTASSGGRLEAWVGEVEADLYRNGVIISKRADVLIGPNVDSGKGIHVAMWGRVDTSKGNACSMTLGIPAATLNAAGLLSDLPDDYVFPVAVQGTALKPVVDWIGAGRELAELLVQHRVAKDLPCLAPFLQRTMGRVSQVVGASRPKVTVPPPLSAFPWEY
eukprot:jgi/Botrbrau1/12989/Bobra.384_1s0014.1